MGIAGRKSTRDDLPASTLDQCQLVGRDSNLGIPGLCRFQAVIDVLDVLDALGVEPVREGFGAAFGIDGNAVFPGRAPAQYSVEAGSTLCRQFQGLDKDRITYARGKVDEGLVGGGGSILEMVQSF